ncbi:carbamoyl-phosphate synthase large subunit [bacterium]|nr:carbamoyl-phosphate synthase large subunit [bacterium]
MPKREDIQKILIIGSGPIVIGQACEFDYSGTQAAKALREDGFEVVLVNSNPATIMTDPDVSDQTYIEPITPETVRAVIEKERPDAVLATMGGQTGLNAALELHELGVFEEFGCELIGARVESITMAEDRELFREAMDEIGLSSAKSRIAHSLKDLDAIADELGFPLILRPSRTLGGSGGGIAQNAQELKQLTASALQASPNGEVLIEESLLGWKEIELEVMRDRKDNVVIVCGIENLDPMGIHTGDSITVAPVQTLTDKEYQELRDAAIAVMRKIGVESGGSNVQFALNPKDGRIIVIEMNPRVSRSSALASKATGFPIAKFSAKLAVGYTLDEIQNDITRETPACFEPALDYVVVKTPRFTFEKFPLAEPVLGTQMKSVGEAMSFGRSIREALQKVLSSLEVGADGFSLGEKYSSLGKQEIVQACAAPSPERIFIVAEAFRKGASRDEVHESSRIDPWFLAQIELIVSDEVQLADFAKNSSSAEEVLEALSKEDLVALKSDGMSDARIAQLLSVPSLSGTDAHSSWQITESDIREKRKGCGIEPSYSLVDTCAGEFEAYTPYYYASYEPSHHAAGESAALRRNPKSKGTVIILGSGPNRIGQGIEFDYCCVHAVLALREHGYEAVMVNCNPETVSTDYDTSSRLYFEPLHLESVLNICEREQPLGVIVQFGGQTPLKLAQDLEKSGVRVLGTSPDSIDLAEDRHLFADVMKRLKLRQTEFAFATSVDEAVQSADKIGYPLVIRPSFVLGGRAMRIVFQESELRNYMQESVDVSHERPVLLDRFLHNAIEVDLDAVSDGNEVVIAGVMEHIERAGIHSGDSSCCLPPQSLSSEVVDQMKAQATELALALEVKGLMNIQFAVSPEQEIYVLEVNPRASRTVPFVSKATGRPWAKVAALVMGGSSLSEALQAYPSKESMSQFWSIKACVFPFKKFPGVDTILGPEMKSTGEVMGIGKTFPEAFGKSQLGAGVKLPMKGTAFLSVRDMDKESLLEIARKLAAVDFQLLATEGTARFLEENSVEVQRVNKVREGSPHIVDMIGAGEVHLVINTPEGHGTFLDSRSIRLMSTEMGVPLYTTTAAGLAAVESLCLRAEEGPSAPVEVSSLQQLLKASEGSSVALSAYEGSARVVGGENL